MPLFNDGVEDSAPVRFDPFRDADDVYGDANDVVSLSELEATPLADRAPRTLGERLYLLSFRRKSCGIAAQVAALAPRRRSRTGRRALVARANGAASNAALASRARARKAT